MSKKDQWIISICLLWVSFVAVLLALRHEPSLPGGEPMSIKPDPLPSLKVSRPEERTKKLHALNLKNEHVLYINSSIGIGTADILGKLAEWGPGRATIYMLVDSPGGDVNDGARIIAAMQASRAPVVAICLNRCASMAAMLMQYGTQRLAVDRSILMFHPASVRGVAPGELDQVVSRLLFTQRYVDKMMGWVAARNHLSYNQFKLMASRELWMDAEDALAQHFIDGIVRLDDAPVAPVPLGEDKAKKDANGWEDVVMSHD